MNLVTTVMGEHWLCARNRAQLFTCIFHDIFTAICFIIISLFYDEKLRLSEIERVALVVELVSGGVGIWTRSLWDSGTHVLSPFCQCLPYFINSYTIFVSLPWLSVSLNYLVFFFKAMIGLRKTKKKSSFETIYHCHNWKANSRVSNGRKS